MTKSIYFMLINKKGNPIIIDGRLPIYHYKTLAAREAMKFKCYVSRVTINHIDAK